MTARAAAGLLVSALVRKVEGAGGHAMVLAKGDAVSGAILLVLADRGVTLGLVERVFDLDSGGYRLQPSGPDDLATLSDYIARRRRSDPDLWVLELDCPEADKIADDMLAG